MNKLQQNDIDINEPDDKPVWVEKLRVKFTSCVSHMFLITGNVRDVIDNRNTIEAYLSKLFLVQGKGSPKYDLVVFYDRANGLRFPIAEMRQRFVEEISKKDSDGKGAGKASVFQSATAAAAFDLPTDPKEAFEEVEKVLKKERVGEDGDTKHTVFIIDYAESLFPSGEWGMLSSEDRTNIVTMLNWAKDPLISKQGNPIILIADSGARIHDSIMSSASRIEMIEILLPTPEERYSFIDYLDKVAKASVGKGKKGGLIFEPKFDKRKFGHLSAGLKRMNIEDIKLTAEQLETPIGPDLVKARKQEIYKQEYQSVLEIVEPEFGFEAIGGMEWLKEYHRIDVIEPMLRGDVQRCPQGLLYIGPPGTGKSVFAKALAKESQMNMCSLNIGKLLGGIVGESEHNMMKALLAIRSLFPVTVWMDEIDQAINRGSTGDSGVSNRLFKMLLEFMSDTSLRGKVLFIAATNRPDMLDPALKRTGRFDKKIPFIPPDAAERPTIFPAVMTKDGIQFEGRMDMEKLAEMTEGWVGSDIEAAVIKAFQLAGRDGRTKVTQTDLTNAISRILPSSQEVELWTKLALYETSDIDLLPPSIQEAFDRKKLEREIRRLSSNSLKMQFEEHRQARKREL